METKTFQHTLPTGEEIEYRVTRRTDMDSEADFGVMYGGVVPMYAVLVAYPAGIDLGAFRMDDAYPCEEITAWLGEVVGEPVRFVDCGYSSADGESAYEVWNFRAGAAD